MPPMSCACVSKLALGRKLVLNSLYIPLFESPLLTPLWLELKPNSPLFCLGHSTHRRSSKEHVVPKRSCLLLMICPGDHNPCPVGHMAVPVPGLGIDTRNIRLATMGALSIVLSGCYSPFWLPSLIRALRDPLVMPAGTCV